jgi:HPt (histidine-containing phosphotransfer) domain-containing protein
MASYLEKMRRQSKQLFPQTKQKHGAPPIEDPPKLSESAVPKVEDAAVPKIEEPSAGPSGPVPSPPAATVTNASEQLESDPVLDAEDQRFLERLAAIAVEPEGTPPPLPQRTETVDDNGDKKVGRDAQTALMDNADKVPLPLSPPETTADASDKGKGKAGEGGLGRKKSVLSYFQLPKFNKKDGEKASKDKKIVVTEKDRTQFADDLHAAAESAKNAELTDAEKENKELTDILDQLNLSAVNNRVFSFSKESEELLNKFTLVLKDLVNGVPTAYNDLEKLFTDYDNQLKKMYGSLPPFLQNLVKSLPAKLTATLGPELMAASSEKPGFDAQAASKSKGKRSLLPQVPSLKSLVSAQGAVATALKSIVNFLKFRFPALATGTNVIMSLAVFVLLFVFWYCHKRGRETRLEKERLAAEDGQPGRISSASSINEDADSIFGDPSKSKTRDSGKVTPASPAQEPLIIKDNKEKEGESSAAVADLPSVSHLPDPKSGEVPKTATPPPDRK